MAVLGFRDRDLYRDIYLAARFFSTIYDSGRDNSFIAATVRSDEKGGLYLEVIYNLSMRNYVAPGEFYNHPFKLYFLDRGKRIAIED